MSPSASGRRHVVLGVCGGIAAYKAAEVLRGLQRAGLDVRACLTESATRFVGPLTFAALSGHAVSHGRLGGEGDADMAHVEITRDAALFVVAPATANSLAKFARGLADDWLTTHFLANQAPVVLAPAMNQRMWQHPAVQENLRILEGRGAAIVAPEDGELACGEVGPGRLADPEVIVSRALAVLEAPPAVPAGGWYRGRAVLVTAGPTQEPLDAVRFIGNRSSGKMGYALAAEAARRGARVTLVSGPVALAPPPGCDVVRVRTAGEMADAVKQALPAASVAFFAAAVADFRPDGVDGKIRREGRDALTVTLTRTRDVLAEAVASGSPGVLVGFAAETGDVLPAARDKRVRKGCAFLVANRVDGPHPAIDADDNEVVLLGPNGLEVALPRAPKAIVASRLLDEIARAVGEAGEHA